MNDVDARIQALAQEMLRIAEDLGEPDDPFAAWEALAEAIRKGE